MTDKPIDDLTDAPAAGNEPPPEKVGYCHPPKAFQFSKDRPGNLKGRPKKSKNLKTVFNTEMDEVVKVEIGGVVQKITNRAFVVKKQISKAKTGDSKAAAVVLNMDMQFNPSEVETDGDMPLSADDKELLANYLAWNAKIKSRG